MRTIVLILLILYCPYLAAQELPSNPHNYSEEDLNSSGVRDVKYDSERSYGYERFFQEFRINDNNQVLRVELLQMNALESTTLELPILIKHRVTERFSILFGPKIDATLSPSGSNIGFSVKMGAQYDITKNWYIEGGFEYQLKSAFPQGHFKHGAKGSFYLGTGVKF